uniref:PGG domain-containing protein n=1 Tax=Kalanchoe fedtschenkoi TaxID=63787 RepID=A0A7N0U3U1_KALFE
MKYPNLAIERNRKGITAIQRLATKPKDFPSGTSEWFWEKFIYLCIPVDSRTDIELNLNSKGMASEPIKRSYRHGRNDLPFFTPPLRLHAFGCCSLHLLIWRFIRYAVPLVNRIGIAKLIHKQTDQLMKDICATVLNTRNYTSVWTVLGPATYKAAVNGIHELIEECLRCYPGLIWYKSEGSYLMFNAIKYRQVKVYNLVYQMTGHVALAASDVTDGENALHQVARIALPYRVNTVTGAALQMQRELQWFKEVEKFVQPAYRDILNKENKTPQRLFTEEHREMVEKGEKWMKDTSSSSMVVAALIFTVAFAAIFTVPGGPKDDGTPLLSKDRTFMLFAASDAIALFASATSVLMFLAILTSRFAEDDFLYALPKRLCIGLVSLFVSIAATMVAFSATLALVLRQELAWIALPVGLIACIPVIFFAMLQFPLLVELVISTYGPSIFHKQNSLVLY